MVLTGFLLVPLPPFLHPPLFVLFVFALFDFHAACCLLLRLDRLVFRVLLVLPVQRQEWPRTTTAVLLLSFDIIDHGPWIVPVWRRNGRRFTVRGTVPKVLGFVEHSLNPVGSDGSSCLDRPRAVRARDPGVAGIVKVEVG